MTPINKAHPDIQTSPWVIFITIKINPNGGMIYFSKGACAKFNIHIGDKIEFFNDPWRFVVSKNPDGFLVSDAGADPKSRFKSCKVSNKALVNMILNNLALQEIKPKPRDHFLLQKTSHQINGNPIIEILFNKPTNLLGK